MGRLKEFLFRHTRLFWLPRQRYAYLCQRSGFYDAV